MDLVKVAVSTNSLLAKLGGEDRLDTAVDLFYTRVFVDKELGRFFKGYDAKRLRRHQKRFLRIAFTGIPKSMDVTKKMKEKHAKLFQQGLNEHHFDLVLGYLISALKDTGVEQEQLDEAARTL